MHETTIPYIGKDNIQTFINEFINEVMMVNGINTELNMLIVGGLALDIKYGYRSTVDIDSEIRTRANIASCIKNVSQRLGIPKDFINEDFMKSHSYSRHLWDMAVLVYRVNSTSIYVVSDIDQLCMKIVSGRTKDINDILVYTGQSHRARIHLWRCNESIKYFILWH